MMRVEQIRKSLPKTMEALRSGVADRYRTVARSDAVAKARKAVRRGSEETMKWVRRNPRALPLAGVGLGGALATWLLVRSRRNARRPRLFQKAMKTVTSLPGVRRGFASSFVRFLGWAMTPRKPHVFRAISVRW